MCVLTLYSRTRQKRLAYTRVTLAVVVVLLAVVRRTCALAVTGLSRVEEGGVVGRSGERGVSPLDDEEKLHQSGSEQRRQLQLFGGPRTYQEGEIVPLFVNKIGPFNNPSETYQYYDLPVCKPDEGVRDKILSLGEVLAADRLKTTAYELPFRKNKDRGVLCKLTLTKKEHYKLRQAILKEWYFQMYYDDLPFWGFIGKKENDHTYVQDASKKDDGDHMLAYVFTHINFHVKYNGNHVIEISLSTLPEQSTLLDKIGNYDKEEAKPVELEYTYSVDWEFTETTFDERMGKYRKHSLHPHHLEIHWFSILNSCVTVLLLTGFLATILMRILKSDFAKYSKDVDDELGAADAVEDSGWKFVHGDVFRFPAHKFLLCAIVGTGTQLLCLVCAIGTLALMGFYYPYNRGAMLATGVVLYGLSTFISGYYAVKLYTQLKGENWIRMVLITAAAFTLPFMGVFSYLNTVALAYNSTAALPFGTILILTIGWIVIGFPLTVIGGIMGKESKEEFSAPCRTTKYPREIPELPWYRSTFPQMMIAGFLPFSAIYIELYYIFASVWGHKIYTIYSILCIVFAILLIVTAFMTIAITYFQLAVEDYQWWWRSVFCGGAVSVFVFMYAVYYYHFRSDMDGWMQTSFFFGYMAVACYGLFMMLGMVGFRSALMFCKYIYQNIKTD